MLRSGWTAVVDDYAIACGWACKGTLLVVCDVAGGVYAFEGTSGAVRWQHPGVHDGGALAMSVQPTGTMVATAGQDGRILVWNAKDGQLHQTLNLGQGWVENVAWSADGQRLAATMSRRRCAGCGGRSAAAPAASRGRRRCLAALARLLQKASDAAMRHVCHRE